ncbi:MAG: hypothetical protein KJ621_20015 [Proteobacteria bacterium]|nr:hypothetical protein [Pseudomonadota bacterium]
MKRLIAWCLLAAWLLTAAGCAGVFEPAGWGPRPKCGWEFRDGCDATSWPYGYLGGP